MTASASPRSFLGREDGFRCSINNRATRGLDGVPPAAILIYSPRFVLTKRKNKITQRIFGADAVAVEGNNDAYPRIERMEAVDTFPHTDHIETIVSLVRRRSSLCFES